MKTFIREFLTVLIIAAVLIVGLQVVIQKFVVDGPSMGTSFRDGQQVLVNKVVYKFHEPERGDVIIFRPPENETDDYIKRIVGLPGESVEIKDGKVYIHEGNGTTLPLDEPYITQIARESFTGNIIPENEYFVLGDNRNNSSDSRSDWTVPFQNIIGKAWVSVWPPDRWGLVVNHLESYQ
ncbi:signal peptidase I [Chloroflexota bacterium]